MFGNLGEMAKLMQMAKDLPAKLKRIKEDLSRTEYTSKSACGGVEATVSGDFIIKSLLLSGDVDGETVRNTVNEALNMAKLGAQGKMSEATGGLDLPGLF